VTIKEATRREIDKHAEYIIPLYVEQECQLCHTLTELRAGVCWDCMPLAETDMKEVWEIANPVHRWPYVWSVGHELIRLIFRQQNG